MTAEAGFGVVPLEQVRTMDGLTLIKGLMEGRFPAPPISEVPVRTAPGAFPRITTRSARSMAASPPPCSIR